MKLLAEFLELAAASGIFVALSARQTRLLREYRCRGSLSRQDDQHCGRHPSRHCPVEAPAMPSNGMFRISVTSD